MSLGCCGGKNTKPGKGRSRYFPASPTTNRTPRTRLCYNEPHREGTAGLEDLKTSLLEPLIFKEILVSFKGTPVDEVGAPLP